MGMIQTLMKKVPDDKSADVFAGEVAARAKAQMDEDAGNSHDGCDCRVLKLENFDEAWNDQENLKDTPEIREKYRQLTQEGRVILLEMDW